MKLYAPEGAITIACPACRAAVGVWCAPWMVCERRLRAWGSAE